MRILGMVTTSMLLVTAVVAVVVGLRSIPDFQRYLKIRRM